jgi:putative chitinase
MKKVLLIGGCILIASAITFLIIKHFKKPVNINQLEGNAKILVDELANVGITNPFIVGGILGVTEEESGITPKREMSYRNTSASRLLSIFPTALSPYSNSDIDTFKQDDSTFFDIIYGGQGGNDRVGDGFKYRGGGLNQITFKNEYDKYGKRVEIDLLNAPELITDIQVAAMVCAQYFKDGIITAIRKGIITSMTDIKDLKNGALLAFKINVGLGTNINTAFLQTRLASAENSASNYTV